LAFPPVARAVEALAAAVRRDLPQLAGWGFAPAARRSVELAFPLRVVPGLAARAALVHLDWRLQVDWDSDPAALVPATSAFLPDFRGAQARRSLSGRESAWAPESVLPAPQLVWPPAWQQSAGPAG